MQPCALGSRSPTSSPGTFDQYVLSKSTRPAWVGFDDAPRKVTKLGFVPMTVLAVDADPAGVPAVHFFHRIEGNPIQLIQCNTGPSTGHVEGPVGVCFMRLDDHVAGV